MEGWDGVCEHHIMEECQGLVSFRVFYFLTHDVHMPEKEQVPLKNPISLPPAFAPHTVPPPPPPDQSLLSVPFPKTQRIRHWLGHE